jgi:hypothetical protein
MKNLVLMTMLLIFNTALACDPVKFVEKGAAAPCTGYLFTPEKEKEVRMQVIDLQYEKELSLSKDRQIELYKKENAILTERYQIWSVEAKALSSDLSKERNSTFWRNTLYFALGMLITTGVTYAVNQ